MDNTCLNKYVILLSDFILSIETDFIPFDDQSPYYHMGATLTDSILQAGINYKHVVLPRVNKLLTQYSSFNTTCDFIILMDMIPLEELINWKNKEKLVRIEELTWLMYRNGINNENELAEWLSISDNLEELIRIKGVGPKTVDYICMLAGIQSFAIDRHLYSFLEMSGIYIKTYQEAIRIYTATSEYLNINKYQLDKNIWTYMSTKNPQVANNIDSF